MQSQINSKEKKKSGGIPADRLGANQGLAAADIAKEKGMR